MPNTSMSLYQLLDGMLGRGLPFVASYLAKKLGHPLVITDSIGRIHYPDEPGTPSPLEGIFTALPAELDDNDVYYQAEEERLIYHIGQGRPGAYIIVNKIPGDLVPRIMASMAEEPLLAIKYYFTNLDKMRESQVAFKKELAEYVLFKSNANIRDIIKLTNMDLEIDKPYLIAITEIDEPDGEVDWEMLSSVTSQHLKRLNTEIIPISWTNCLLQIFPASFLPNTLEIDPEWTRQIRLNSLKFIDIVGQITKKTPSIGIGQTYVLADLHKSYNEARVALTLARLMGKRHFVQQFADLGVFSFIFSQDIEDIKKYCFRILGRLIEHDEKNGAEMLPTLRYLVDSDFNRKSTADSMFIHINTLHYRLNKIEQLLEMGLNETSTRLNLFTAIKVWDTLKINGYMD